MKAVHGPKPFLPEHPVESLPGLGSKRAALLHAIGVSTIGGLLMYCPRAYADRTRLTAVGDVVEGERVTVQVRVVRSRFIRFRGRLNMAEVTFEDDTGCIKATWFGQGYLARAFREGKLAILTGVAGSYKGLALKNPDYEILAGDDEDLIHTGRLVPIYRLGGKLGQRQLRTWIHAALEACAESVPETLPERVRRARNFGPIADDLWQVHFPATPGIAEHARQRLAYEELFALQSRILRQRSRRREMELGVRHRIDGTVLNQLRTSLPFEPTPAQTRVIHAILADMASPRPMARLLQGDVGSGKTLVALHAAAAAIDSGSQVALMAPTELLAEQHAATAARFLEPLGIRIGLLTGATGAGKKTTLRALATGEAQLVVGTHALFQERTEFQNLGLVIVDEQHRFGVLQRDRLARKGRYPDLLQLTATPIPRTIALTVYGAMDISIIDELPPGRRPVDTFRVEDSGLQGLHSHVCREAGEGRQTFIICPLIDESDKRALRAVTTHFKELSSGPLKGLRTALVHGRLEGQDKDSAMRAFAQGETDVLFATSVVEVGIDVPNATIMVIEDAASFGLTQLHQLRGRVGRGQNASTCYLLGEPKTDEGRQRLDVMCRTNDGFEIAEADLRLRGPGQVQGVNQHGMPDLKVADLLRDVKLIEQARIDAESCV